MNIDLFGKEMLISQKQGRMTAYVDKHWETALKFLKNINIDMDELVELALCVTNEDTEDNRDRYNSFVDSLENN